MLLQLVPFVQVQGHTLLARLPRTRTLVFVVPCNDVVEWSKAVCVCVCVCVCVFGERIASYRIDSDRIKPYYTTPPEVHTRSTGATHMHVWLMGG
jgi:hypothetical protein